MKCRQRGVNMKNMHKNIMQCLFHRLKNTYKKNVEHRFKKNIHNILLVALVDSVLIPAVTGIPK